MSKYETMCLWCEIYRAGYRITIDNGRFVCHSVDWLRVYNTKQFGRFDIAPTEPPKEIVDTIEANRVDLVALLNKPIVPELSQWFFHPLVLEYEARPLAMMAAKMGLSVHLELCRMGIWPVLVPGEKPEERQSVSLPELAPILRNNGFSYYQESYRMMEAAHVKKKS